MAVFFFNQYSDFHWNPTEDAESEFLRLAFQQGWKKGRPSWRKHRMHFMDTVFPYENDDTVPFFRRFPEFKYREKLDNAQNFCNLAVQRGWKARTPAWKFYRNLAETSGLSFPAHGFFAQFKFQLDPKADPEKEFNRLAMESGWTVKAHTWNCKWNEFKRWQRREQAAAKHPVDKSLWHLRSHKEAAQKRRRKLRYKPRYFFDRYPDFKRDPQMSVKENFDRLAYKRRWQDTKGTAKRLNRAIWSEVLRESDERVAAHEKHQVAMNDLTFNMLGLDVTPSAVNDLASNMLILNVTPALADTHAELFHPQDVEMGGL